MSNNNNNNRNNNNNNNNQNRSSQAGHNRDNNNSRPVRNDQQNNNNNNNQNRNQNRSYQHDTSTASGYQRNESNNACASGISSRDNNRPDSACSNQSGYNNSNNYRYNNNYQNRWNQNNSGYQRYDRNSNYNNNNRGGSAFSRQADQSYSNRGSYSQNSYASNQVVGYHRNDKIKEVCRNQVIKCLKDFAYVDLTSVRSRNPHAFVFKKRNGSITIGETKLNFLVNHFDFDFNDLEFNIFRVDIKQEGRNNKNDIGKKIKRGIYEEFIKNCFNLDQKAEKQPIVVYDGDTLLFVESFYPLKDQNDEVTIEKKTYKYFISATTRVIKLSDLKRFLKGDENFNIGLVHPCIQVLNLLSKERLAIHFQCFGKFYFNGHNYFDLQDGHIVWKGFTLNARPSGNSMTLVINSSGCVMPKRQPLLDYLFERFKLRDVNDIWNKIDTINDDIEGLKVNLTHLDYTKKMSINSLYNKSADQHKFCLDDKKTEVTVAQYYKDKYPNKKLKYPDLPLVLEVRKNNKTGEMKRSYYPIEICEVLDIRSNIRESPQQKSEVIKATKEGPVKKFQRIMESREDKNFINVHSNISKNMKMVIGNVLPYPRLNYRQNKYIKCNDNGSWNVNDFEFFTPIEVENTIAINFSRESLESVKYFFNGLADMAIQRGMNWKNETNVISSTQNEVLNTLNKITENNKKWDIVFYILDKKCEFHELFKTLSEIVFGLRSICILTSSMTNDPRRRPDDILRNLCLKINERLDGVNQILNSDEYIKDVFSEPVMFISADVSHPGAGNHGFPSLAAVVGSVDGYAKKYACRMRAQWHQRSNKKKESNSNEDDNADKESGSAQEVIVDLKSIIKDLLQVHVSKQNGQIPSRVIYYRDGVSEGQFGIVAEKELPMIKDAIQELYPNNKIKVTFITVQKRHSTRIFIPTSGGKSVVDENPKPGTVISEGVCNSTESESYLLSHKLSPHGTAKPSHYKCISDENDFTENQLNSLHFYLCHLYARCNRSVKIPTPVYYADLASTRGMLYLKIGTDKEWREKAMNILNEHPGQIQYFDIPIHANIKNELFFI